MPEEATSTTDRRGAGGDRRTDPVPGTAQTKALESVARATAEGVAYGSLGLKGWWQNVGNATAMMIIVIFTFWLYRDMMASMKGNQDYERQERRDQRAEDSRNREATNAEIRALTTEVRTSNELSREALRTTRSALARPEFAPAPKHKEE